MKKYLLFALLVCAIPVQAQKNKLRRTLWAALKTTAGGYGVWQMRGRDVFNQLKLRAQRIWSLRNSRGYTTPVPGRRAQQVVDRDYLLYHGSVSSSAAYTCLSGVFQLLEIMGECDNKKLEL